MTEFAPIIWVVVYILGASLVSKECENKKYSAIQACSIGACYGVSATIFIVLFGYFSANEVMLIKGSLLYTVGVAGGLALFSGVRCYNSNIKS
ncbi:MAG: hypothetical protein ACJAYG_002360 [Oceanicoccus sp.]|jgi:hypothetical protein